MIGQPDDFVDAIFGDLEYRPVQALPKSFKPWHKPRKQFVRREQWSSLLQQLYEDRRPEDPLRYLGLPGTDLIDLRYLYEELCRPEGRTLRFLGFNSAAQPGSPADIDLSVSLDEVRQLPNVDPQSRVMPDDFRLIGKQESVARSKALSLGPFDVINIDLCDGLASDPPYSDGAIYDAITLLVALQARNNTPWLLLITTRIGQTAFHKDAEDRLLQLFRRNVAECEGFLEECQRILSSDVMSLDPKRCEGVDLVTLMTAAIGKWVAALAQAQAPSRVELASTHGYRIDAASPCEDLVSIALRFEPVVKESPDPFSPAPPVSTYECSNAKGILRRSARRRDVDDILANAPDINEELINETSDLLEQARYDVTEYRRWLAS